MKVSRPSAKLICQLATIIALCAVLFFSSDLVPFKQSSAWLQTTGNTPTNNFVGSNLTISLTGTQKITLLPGADIGIVNYPYVTISKGSEACYLFVKPVEANDFGEYVDYSFLSSYTEVSAGYYCRKVGEVGTPLAAGQNCLFFPGKSGTDVFGNSMAYSYIHAREYKKDGTTDINTTNLSAQTGSLTLKVYCVQQANLTPAEALAIAKPYLDA